MVYEGIIEGLTVNMRSVVPEDAEVTYSMRMDDEKVHYMHKINGTVNDQRNYIINQNKKTGDYLFLVLDKSGKPIGMRGIYDISGDSAESGRTIGYGDAFQNIEAIILGLDFAFYELGMNKIYMDAFEDNNTVRGIQKAMGAEEIERNTIPGWDTANIRSVLSREKYSTQRKSIMNMIEKHVRRSRN